MAEQTPRRAWTIDVCRICDRLAVWPFCEHYSTTERWTEPVTVTTRAKKRRTTDG